MNFKSLFILIFVFFVSSVCDLLKSQIPANDLNWQLDTTQSDEFNLDTINTNLWHILDCPSGDCCNWAGGTAFQKGNVSDSAGILRLRVDGPGESPVPCDRYTYNTGGIKTKALNYSYGYFEISAQLPGFYNNGVPCASKFEPTFWMAYQKFDTGCLVVHNEIDFFDINGIQMVHCDSISSGWWRENGHCANYCAGQVQIHTQTPLFTSFHKYSAIWQPGSVIFMFDGVPYFERHNDTTLIMNPQRIYINQSISDTNIHFCSGIPFPQYYLVDYFRYYTLKLDCASGAVLLSNTDIANYIYSVKSFITFGNGSSIMSLNSSDVKYYRAVDSITIHGTFTAPLGSELGLIPTPCN